MLLLLFLSVRPGNLEGLPMAAVLAGQGRDDVPVPQLPLGPGGWSRVCGV